MKLKRVLTAAILAVSILVGTAVPALAGTNADFRHLTGQAWGTWSRVTAKPSLISLGYQALSDHTVAKAPPDRHQSLGNGRPKTEQLKRPAANRASLTVQAKARADAARTQALAAQRKAATERLASKVRMTVVARARIVSLAKQYLGVPYVWAGTSPRGFDCSGFVLYVYKKLGVNLPHFAASQYACGSRVNRSQLQPGDLVFFYRPIHHVGIYIGSGQMINARGTRVQIEPLWNSYAGATRLIS